MKLIQWQLRPADRSGQTAICEWMLPIGSHLEVVISHHYGLSSKYVCMVMSVSLYLELLLTDNQGIRIYSDASHAAFRSSLAYMQRQPVLMHKESRAITCAG